MPPDLKQKFFFKVADFKRYLSEHKWSVSKQIRIVLALKVTELFFSNEYVNIYFTLINKHSENWVIIKNNGMHIK